MQQNTNEAWLSTISYKDNFKLKVVNGDTLSITMRVNCRDMTGNTVLVGGGSKIPKFQRKSDFLSWVFKEILKFEKHEAAEWFRVCGVLIYDPHRKGV